VALRCGDTFLVPKSSDQTEHLWIIVSPSEDGKAVCVSVTTRRAYSETTVVLQRGDHPFVSHESVIYYQDARILDLNLVERALNAGIRDFVCTLREPCDADLLRRIQAGMVLSKQPKKEVKDFFKRIMGIG
jgi:hypothetical protein